MSGAQMSDLVGKTATEIDGMEAGSEQYTITFSDGSSLVHYHQKECCESVSVEDVCGDVADLIGAPLVMCEAVQADPPASVPEDHDDSYTWTFYKFATAKGYVTVRWFGSSNGYYGEEPAERVWIP